jgi:hypothetical protein
MKKNYLLFAALFVSTILSAQDAFWSVTNYKGAFPVTDNTPATDWTSGWSNFDPENTVYPATTSTVSTDITTNTTWSGIILLRIEIVDGRIRTVEVISIIVVASIVQCEPGHLVSHFEKVYLFVQIYIFEIP